MDLKTTQDFEKAQAAAEVMAADLMKLGQGEHAGVVKQLGLGFAKPTGSLGSIPVSEFFVFNRANEVVRKTLIANGTYDELRSATYQAYPREWRDGLNSPELKSLLEIVEGDLVVPSGKQARQL